MIMKNNTIRKNREQTGQTLTILWQPVPAKNESEKETARILRVYGNHPCFRLPDMIEGMPVTEIGPYCFSMSEPKVTGESFWFPFQPEKEALPPSLSGRFVESITLPASVTTLHNAAFYNCRKLHTLSVGSHIEAIGSDEFTNCSRLKNLILRCHDAEATGLPLVLERIDTDLNVSFFPERKAEISSSESLSSDGNAQPCAALFFPEYYEWLDEISPAHIFSRSIHGEGFRMRKCFQEKVLDYRKYDQCFENALTVESEKSLCKISLNRLQWPNHLEKEFRILYENTVQKHFDTAFSLAVDNRDTHLLTFLSTYFSLSPEEFSKGISLCIAADWSSGAALLMEQKHRAGSFANKTFDFDDF